MAGIVVQKNYVSSNLTNVNLANNWMVLVFGVTNQGPTTPTLVQSYASFTGTFGQPVANVATHAYVQFLLNSGVPVLFKRVIDADELIKASITVKGTASADLFSITATDNYNGSVGNNIDVVISKNNVTNACTMNVEFEQTTVETYSLGVATSTITLGDLLYNFVSEASGSGSLNSQYITLKMINSNAAQWKDAFTEDSTKHTLIGGETPDNDLNAAISILKDPSNKFWKDAKLADAMTYYPQLRFITSGGLIAEDTDTQTLINQNMGLFAINCKSSFRVLIDYPLGTKDVLKIVREFARTEGSTGTVNPAMYAYFGDWGADNNNNWLPGSAGFLTALALAGYNVYSRRIAGTGFTPAFTKSYTDLYIDSLNNWQAEDLVQLNPIVIVDAQNNLAVMGSSTLAMPLSSLSARNPAQALDVVLVGDYIAAILNNIALGELESAFDRLSLNSLSSRMTTEVERFVTSRAITRYEFEFDTTQLGKLGINCTLYFAIGLKEVSLTITSVYDTSAIS